MESYFQTHDSSIYYHLQHETGCSDLIHKVILWLMAVQISKRVVRFIKHNLELPKFNHNIAKILMTPCLH